MKDTSITNETLQNKFEQYKSVLAANALTHKLESPIITMGDLINESIINNFAPCRIGFLENLANYIVQAKYDDDMSTQEKQERYYDVIKRISRIYEKYPYNLDILCNIMVGHYPSELPEIPDFFSPTNDIKNPPTTPFDFWDALKFLKDTENEILSKIAKDINSNGENHYIFEDDYTL